VVEALSARRYPEGHEFRVHSNGRSYIPQFVFLDAKGARVFQTRGFNNEFEAKAMHAYVASRAYEKSSFQEFSASYKE